MMQPLALIVAHAQNRVIGADGDMPWHYPEDLKHFKRETLGHTVIMGRLSCEALPGGPLPKRRNLVVTRNPDYQCDGFEVFTDLEAAIAAARKSDDCPFILGGGQIYKLSMPLVTKMIITEIQRSFDGDAFFPEYNEDAWTETKRETGDELVFRWLERKDQSGS